MFKGALIFAFGGLVGLVFGAIGGGILGYFGGTIWTELMKEEGKKEAYAKVGPPNSVSYPANYRGMSSPSQTTFTIDEERLEEIMTATVENPVELDKDEINQLDPMGVMVGLHYGHFKLAYPLAEAVEAPTT